MNKESEIPDYNIKNLFTDFHILNGATGKLRDHGFSLAICKKIIEKHGGQISIKSQTDCGTSFFFTLPF